MNNLLAALKNKAFLFLWLAEVLSQIASNMTNFILLLVVFSLTHSNTAVSGIMIAFLLPAIALGILAGVYVDRRDKKHVLTVTNIVRAGILLLLALFHSNLPGVYLLTFAVAAATQFFIPAETPMIPLLVKKHMLLASNALFGIAFYGSLLIAYALSGPFLIFFGKQMAFVILAGMFLAAAILSGLIKRSDDVKKESKKGANLTVSGEVKTVLSLIFTIRNIYNSFFMLALSQILVLVIAVLGPGFASGILHIPVDTFPLLFVTPAALGMGIGAYMLINYFHQRNRIKVAILGLFGTSVALIILPFAGNIASFPIFPEVNHFLPQLLHITKLHVVSGIAFLSGIANALIFVPSNTLIQEETSDEVRGKIYGALNALIALLSILPIMVVGPLADVFGVSSVIVAIGICVGIIGIVRVIVQ
jgi:MFS family permease